MEAAGEIGWGGYPRSTSLLLRGLLKAVVPATCSGPLVYSRFLSRVASIRPLS